MPHRGTEGGLLHAVHGPQPAWRIVAGRVSPHAPCAGVQRPEPLRCRHRGAARGGHDHAAPPPPVRPPVRSRRHHLACVSPGRPAQCTSRSHGSGWSAWRGGRLKPTGRVVEEAPAVHAATTGRHRASDVVTHLAFRLQTHARRQDDQPSTVPPSHAAVRAVAKGRKVASSWVTDTLFGSLFRRRGAPKKKKVESSKSRAGGWPLLARDRCGEHVQEGTFYKKVESSNTGTSNDSSNRIRGRKPSLRQATLTTLRSWGSEVQIISGFAPPAAVRGSHSVTTGPPSCSPC